MLGGMLGAQETVLILLLVLVLFGAKRVPEIMRGFGQGLGEFKQGWKKFQGDLDQMEDTIEEAAR